jgi:hypothetical protein
MHRILSGLIVIASLGLPSPSFAQAVRAVSAGGLFAVDTTTPAGGLFVDGMTAVLPHTAIVGEAQLFGALSTEFLALGGVRQRVPTGRLTDIYGQLLLGIAGGYSRRCDLCGSRVVELGAGADVGLNERWAIRIRADLRTGGSASDLFYLTIGGGVTRQWGRR